MVFAFAHLLLVLADIVVEHSYQMVEARVGTTVASALHRLSTLWAHILPAAARWFSYKKHMQIN